MSRSRISATFLMLIFFHSTTAIAEVYQCQGIWTTKPCSASSKPVKNLRQISRQLEDTSAIPSDSTGETPLVGVTDQEPRARLSQPEETSAVSKSEERCRM